MVDHRADPPAEPTLGGTRPRGRAVAALAAAGTLVAAGLVGYAVWATAACPGEPSDRALAADVPGGGVYPDLGDVRDLRDAETGARLAAVGLPGQPRWALWADLPERRDGELVRRDPEIAAVAVAGSTVVTVQRFGAVSPFGRGPAATVLAAYDAATGAVRWQVEGPSARGEVELVASDAAMLVIAPGSLTAVDVASGEVRWCADAGRDGGTVSVAEAGPAAVVVASQEGSRSLLRALDPATGDERWRVAYDAHDRRLAPVRAGDVVVTYAVPGEGGDSQLQAFDAATGAPRWTAPSDPPVALAGAADALVVATGNRDAGVSLLDPADGRPRWTVPLATRGLVTTTVLDDGVLVGVRSFPGEVLLLDRATGAQRWRTPGSEIEAYADEGPWPVVNGRLAFSGRRQLGVLDPATGAVTATATDGEELRAVSPDARWAVIRSGDRWGVFGT
ncbi:PQQ-binding-like beta-propeller repeat protein [Pseudonocardia sp.]|uniref:PQQ-binding-like beta-propeller repeat protein n=1 Tax=Pseudonocardia sp. TaxID=60912 RepID=UPI003D14E915